MGVMRKLECSLIPFVPCPILLEEESHVFYLQIIIIHFSSVTSILKKPAPILKRMGAGLFPPCFVECVIYRFTAYNVALAASNFCRLIRSTRSYQR